MTLAMPDSIYPLRLPSGYPAYLGYADGKWPTAATIERQHPGAKFAILTVTGATLDADGIDVEEGNPDAKTGAAWIARKLLAEPHARPVAYADLATPGYSMADVLAELGKLGIARQQVRVLSAHYTGRPHICSPATCETGPGKPITFTADGTQWTSQFSGNGGLIDMSELADGFFGPPPRPGKVTWAMWPVTVILREGSRGDAVRVLQTACRDSGIAGVRGITVDGDFGDQTLTAVRNFQHARGLAVDGVAGPLTRAALEALGDLPGYAGGNPTMER